MACVSVHPSSPSIWYMADTLRNVLNRTLAVLGELVLHGCESRWAEAQHRDPYQGANMCNNTEYQ